MKGKNRMKMLKLSPYCLPEQESSTHLTNDLTAAFLANGITIENYVPTPTRGVSNEVRRKYRKEESHPSSVTRKCHS